MCYYTYLFVYLYLYIYVLNYQFFLVLAAFGPISLFLVTAFLTVLAYKQKRVRFWNYNNNKKRVTPSRWQRSYRRAPIWLPRLFAWLEKGNSECAVAILARDLGTDGGTNHRICDCWIYLASPRDMPFWPCTAQKNPGRGSRTELFLSKHIGLEACLFWGRGGVGGG